MFNNKKAAAFILGLLICASAATAVPTGVFAENDDAQVTTAAEETTAEETTDKDNEDETIYSGSFGYTVTPSGTVSVCDFKGTDTEVVIPEELDGMAVTEIASNAFLSKYMITKITIPKSVTYISEDNPFLEMNSLEKFEVDSANENYCAVDGVLFTKNMDRLCSYPIKKSGESYTVPDGVESIGIAAFSGSHLSEIKFPQSITLLNRHAFYECQSLKSLDLSNTKTEELGIFCFLECSALSDVLLPDTLVNIEAGAFVSCTSLTDIKLPESLKSVGQNAFADTGLMQIRVPASVTDIGYCAFGYDKDLSMIGGFVIIGEYGTAAYSYCKDSDSEYDYKNDFEFKTNAQADEEAEYAALNVQYYEGFLYSLLDSGDAMIAGYDGINSTITVPSEIEGHTVTRIYKTAFYNCNATVIELPATVKTIDKIAFLACASVKEITIPNGIETIGDEVFEDCTSLEKITIGGTCKEIGYNAFSNCQSLKEIIVTDGEGGDISSSNGILYNKDKSVLIAYPPAKDGKTYRAPSSVKEIRGFSMAFCDNLETVNLSGVKVIGNSALEGCSSLRNVKLSKKLESVGSYAFFGCTSLKSLRLYDAVTTIGDEAFGFCYTDDPAAETQTTTESSGETTGYDSSITDARISGFRIYANKGTLAEEYCQAHNIKLVTGTIGILGLNLEAPFVYVISGIFGAFLLAVIGVFTGKSLKKKKSGKAEKSGRRASSEAAGEDDNDDAQEPEKEDSDENDENE